MSKRLLAELLWILASIVLITIILMPIYQNEKNFEFYIQNIAFILIMVNFVRYIFLLKYSFLYRNKWIKAILIFLCIPIFIYLIDAFFMFQAFLDENGNNVFYEHLSFERQKFLGNYTRNEMVFFGVGSIIATISFPIRMLISIWKDINYKN